VTWLAVACAALAAALLVPPRLRAQGGAVAPSRSLVALAAGLGGVVVVRIAPETVVLVALAAGAAGAGLVLWRGRSARRSAVEVSSRVLETCELLAAELAAGQPPGVALDRAARSWPPLAPVAESFRVGADVPNALRDLASGPGARDLRLVAAAWQVAHRTGHGLAEAVERVADGLRSAEGTRRVVEGELASARATARLVAGLPVLALAMGSGAGGDPWGFLLGQPLGLGCLAGGLAFGFAGLWWIEAIARDVDRSG
jgi:tight adherence protein B